MESTSAGNLIGRTTLATAPVSRYQALERAAAAIERAENGGGQSALDAADRWLELAHRWADQ